MISREQHWQSVYAGKPAQELGWYSPHLRTSLAWIDALALAPHAPIIDVGGGASTLVDDLLARGHERVTVLDLSASALAAAKARLGARARPVTWIHGDVLDADLPESHYALWHDRAAFHFLLRDEEQERYRERLARTLGASGRLIVATFDLHAPPSCSGLPVNRHDVQRLEQVFGAGFELERAHREVHRTPSGVEQAYVYCQFRKAC